MVEYSLDRRKVGGSSPPELTAQNANLSLLFLAGIVQW